MKPYGKSQGFYPTSKANVTPRKRFPPIALPGRATTSRNLTTAAAPPRPDRANVGMVKSGK